MNKETVKTSSFDLSKFECLLMEEVPQSYIDWFNANYEVMPPHFLTNEEREEFKRTGKIMVKVQK